MNSRQRLDLILLHRNLVNSRAQGQAFIRAGKVKVNGVIIDKPGCMISPKAEIEIIESPKFVSRGGYKLEGALNAFEIDVSGMVCLDIGASTGGFTDCLLQRKAKLVYAVDVGFGQLDWKLRNNPSVIVMEKTNARYLKKEMFAHKIDLVCIDVSFISLSKILPPTFDILEKGGMVIALIKPQFEVGKGEVGKGGVVRDPLKHKKAVDKITDFAQKLGFQLKKIIESPLLGPKGNKEFFILCQK